MKDFAENNFNLDRIAGDTIREEDTRTVVHNLGHLFGGGSSQRVAIDRGLRYLYQDVSRLSGADIFTGGADDIELSAPYASFEYSGVKMHQRVARLGLISSPGMALRDGGPRVGSNVGGSIYLLGVAGEGQQQVDIHNFSAGVLTLENGSLEFLKLTDNDNQGETYPGGMAIDNRSVVVETQSPEEQAAFITELTQAAQPQPAKAPVPPDAMPEM